MRKITRALIAEYNSRKKEIKRRLSEFRNIYQGKSEKIFQELCFCLLTANANAVRCHEAIEDLKSGDLILTGSPEQIKPKLKGRARFHNKKADFIVGARKIFFSSKINFNRPLDAREWLVENIKGFGYKEASHFLRNIGLGKDIAILDRHILKNLKKHGVIREIPKAVGVKKTYLGIEEKAKEFARKIKIPLEELDLLFWSIETGFIFK